MRKRRRKRKREEEEEEWKKEERKKEKSSPPQAPLESRTTSAARHKDSKAGGGLHIHTHLCTLVGELGWVSTALPSIQRDIYRGRSWESIDYLHTPAAEAEKVGYSWEMGIPVCPHHGVVPGMQNPSAGHPCIVRQPWISTGTWGLSLNSCTYWHMPGLCHCHDRDGAAILLLQLGGLLPSGTIPTCCGSVERGRRA